MPLPWGGSKAPVFPVTPIAKPMDRAMTLRQLRDLREFVKRLCKGRMLKYPTNEFNDRLERSGKTIPWTQVTQHDITSEVVKKIIPQKHSCSWVELVANGKPQTRKYFISHNWSETFRDFMEALEHHARNNGVALDDSYWICVYANDQWNVVLGKMLKDSPFYEALKDSATTVLMMDKSAEALTRLWVVFEMHETTITLSQKLEIWTPVGRVGSGLVSSGPIVHALDRVDTAKAMASNLCDQRQIMNYVAGVDEMSSMLVAADLTKKLDPAAPSDYEKTLVEERAHTFKNLNSKIKAAAKAQIEDDNELHNNTRRCSIKDAAHRGMTLMQLREFAQTVRSKLASQRTFYKYDKNEETSKEYDLEWDSCNMYHLNWFFIEQPRKAAKCSFVEMVANGPQRPEFSVSFVSTMAFRIIMDAIEWHAEARQLPGQAVYYLAPFAYDEVEVTYKIGVPIELILSEVADGLLMVLDKEANIMSRATCAKEAHLALQNGKLFDLATDTGALATTRPFMSGSWEFGDFSPVTAARVLEFDVAKTTARDETSRRKLLNAIATGIENDDVTPVPHSCTAFVKMNMRVRGKVAGPVIREAAFEGDLVRIKGILAACPQLNVDAPSLQGLLGESALHLAASAGHTQVIHYLLKSKAIVDFPDLQGGTPLHYAVLSGQTPAAELLIKAKADPEDENYDGDSSEEIAQMNSAYFTGVSTAGVSALIAKHNLINTQAIMATLPENDGYNQETQPPLPKIGQLAEDQSCLELVYGLCGESAHPEVQNIRIFFRKLGQADQEQWNQMIQVYRASGGKQLTQPIFSKLLATMSNLTQDECKHIWSAALKDLQDKPHHLTINSDEFVNWLECKSLKKSHIKLPEKGRARGSYRGLPPGI